MNSEEVEQKVLMNSRIQTGILAAFLVIFFLDPRRDKVDTPSISQEANPQITTNVQAPDEIGRIEAMAEERGYYYQSEFGKIWGDKSDQTVGRWRRPTDFLGTMTITGK